MAQTHMTAQTSPRGARARPRLDVGGPWGEGPWRLPIASKCRCATPEGRSRVDPWSRMIRTCISTSAANVAGSSQCEGHHGVATQVGPAYLNVCPSSSRDYLYVAVDADDRAKAVLGGIWRQIMDRDALRRPSISLHREAPLGKNELLLSLGALVLWLVAGSRS